MSRTGRPETLHQDTQKHRRALKASELAAMNLLASAGWSPSTLAMVFEVGETTVYGHLDDGAQHQLQREALRIDREEDL